MGPNSLMVVYVDHLGIFLSRSIFCPVMESTVLEFDLVPRIFHVRLHVRHLRIITLPQEVLEAQLPIYWVPVLNTLYNYILSVTQGPTIWVPGLLGKGLTAVLGGLFCMRAALGFPKERPKRFQDPWE